MSDKFGTKKIIEKTDIALVRPYLEFSISVWNPYFRKDIENLESMKHKAIRFLAINRTILGSVN